MCAVKGNQKNAPTSLEGGVKGICGVRCEGFGGALWGLLEGRS